MKLFPALHTFWWSFLVLCASQSEIENSISDACQLVADQVLVLNSTGPGDVVDTLDLEETFSCLLYPSNLINCSWSFHTMKEDAQLSVHFSNCENDLLVDTQEHPSVGKVGSLDWVFDESKTNQIVLHFNMSYHDKWTVYARMYDIDELRLLPPPANVAASIKDGSLRVTWDMPETETTSESHCFDYELELGEQEKLRSLTDQTSYVEPNAVPARTYRVRIRTRISDVCHGCRHWSEWSPTITVEQSRYRLDPLVIVTISLGIPMILLAVLLLVRHQRLIKILFPPIPRPPQEYKHFLERNDPLSFFHPAPPAKYEEEITEVEDGEQDPEKTF